MSTVVFLDANILAKPFTRASDADSLAVTAVVGGAATGADDQPQPDICNAAEAAVSQARTPDTRPGASSAEEQPLTQRLPRSDKQKRPVSLRDVLAFTTGHVWSSNFRTLVDVAPPHLNNLPPENPLVRLCLDTARDPLARATTAKVQRLLRRRASILRLPVPDTATRRPAPIKPKRTLSPAEQAAVVAARRAGGTLRAVADQFDVSTWTVRQLTRRVQAVG